MKRGDKVDVVLHAPEIADAETKYHCGIYSWMDGDLRSVFEMPMQVEKVRRAPRIGKVKETTVKHLEEVFTVLQWHQESEAKELSERLGTFTTLGADHVWLAALRFQNCEASHLPLPPRHCRLVACGKEKGVERAAVQLACLWETDAARFAPFVDELGSASCREDYVEGLVDVLGFPTQGWWET